MTVKYKNDNKDISYTKEELKSFSKSKLKQINRELQSNIELVSSRRADYLNNNNDGKNSKEYFSKNGKLQASDCYIEKSDYVY